MLNKVVLIHVQWIYGPYFLSLIAHRHLPVVMRKLKDTLAFFRELRFLARPYAHSSGRNLQTIQGVFKFIKIYCDVPGSPCLSRTGPVYGPFFFFKFFG